MLKLGTLILAAVMAGGTPVPRSKGPLPCAHHSARVEYRRPAPERSPNGLGTRDNPIIVESADTAEAKQRADNDALVRREEANNIAWVALLAACLAGLGVVQFLALIAQARWMARNVRVAEESARAAKISADAVIGQFRAYLSVNLAPTRTPAITQQAGPDVVLVARNSGQTPAFDTSHWVMTGIGPAKSSPKFPAPGDIALGKTTIGPGSEIQIRPAPLGQLSEDEWGALHRGEAMIYVWGELKYTDAFRTARHTKFNFMFGPPNTLSPGSLITCPDGNDAT